MENSDRKAARLATISSSTNYSGTSGGINLKVVISERNSDRAIRARKFFKSTFMIDHMKMLEERRKGKIN